MNIQLKYQVNLNGLEVIKTDEEQHNSFFYSGHPDFLVPDFNAEPCDIWLSFMDYLEAQTEEELYDQDGGEIIEHSVIDSATGLTKCKYHAYGIQETEDSDYTDYIVDILGYVVTKDDQTYFIVTEANIAEHANL